MISSSWAITRTFNETDLIGMMKLDSKASRWNGCEGADRQAHPEMRCRQSKDPNVNARINLYEDLRLLITTHSATSGVLARYF